MDERYLSQNEQSRTSARPLPLEVIENIQEAIWSGISGSVKAVLHRLVDMALADEATDRVGAAWHERTAERRAHRNGSYTRDLQTTMGQIEDLRVPRVRMPDGSSPGGWATFDRYERRTYELDRLIGQLFLAGVSGRNLERVSAELWGKKVSRSTVSRATEVFEDEQRAINEAPVPSEVRYLFLDGQNHKVRTELGVTDGQMLAAFAITPDGTERLLAYRLGTSESEAEWALLLEDLKTRGLRTTELIVVDGAGGLEKALQARFPDVPVQRCIMHAARNVDGKGSLAQQGRGGSRPADDLGLAGPGAGDEGLRGVHDQVDRLGGTGGALPRGQDRAVLDLLRLPRGRPVEDQDEQRGGAGVPIRAPASAPDGCVHQRRVGAEDLRCVRRRVEQEEEPSPRGDLHNVTGALGRHGIGRGLGLTTLSAGGEEQSHETRAAASFFTQDMPLTSSSVTSGVPPPS